jgi:hypothetical protein
MSDHMTAEFGKSTEWLRDSPNSDLLDYNAWNEFKHLLKKRE